MSYALAIKLLLILEAVTIAGGVVWLAWITPSKSSPHPPKAAE